MENKFEKYCAMSTVFTFTIILVTQVPSLVAGMNSRVQQAGGLGAGGLDLIFGVL